jgi:hypothetical protein
MTSISASRGVGSARSGLAWVKARKFAGGLGKSGLNCIQFSSEYRPPPGEEHVMSRDVAKIFADIDALTPEKFVAHLTPEQRQSIPTAASSTGGHRQTMLSPTVSVTR